MNRWKYLNIVLPQSTVNIVACLLPGFTALSPDVAAQTTSFAETTTKRVDPEEATTSSPEEDIGRQLMKQARTAFDKKDYVKAKELAEQAKMLKIPVSKWEGNKPETMLAEIESRTGVKGAAPLNVRKPLDPKILVKQGREALDAGKLDQAQDLARQAEATKPSNRWGLFDDTPSSLLRDVQKERAKKEKSDSVRMLAEARQLLEKRTSSDNERKINLEKAQALTVQAEKLHGPYTMWDMGDRPTKLQSEIDTARARVSPTSTAVARRPEPKMDPKGVVRTPEPKMLAQNTPKVPEKNPSPITPVGYNPSKVQPPLSDLKPLDPVSKVAEKTIKPMGLIEESMTTMKPLAPEPPAPVIVSNREAEGKQIANALMNEARACQLRGDFVGAKSRLQEASKYQLYFNSDEESPDFAMLNLNAMAHRKLSSLCNQATETALKRDPASIAESETIIKSAEELARGMGIDMQPTKSVRSMIATVKSNSSNVATAKLTPPIFTTAPHGDNPFDSIVATPKPTPSTAEPPVAMLPRVNPTVPPLKDPSIGVAIVPSNPTISTLPIRTTPTNPAPVVMAPIAVNPMIEKARLELRKGETDSARRLVEEVLGSDSANKDEALALLRTINAEETIQRQRTAMKSFDSGLVAYNNRDFRQSLAIFGLIDDSMLPATKKAQLRELKIASSAGVRNSNPITPVTAPNATNPVNDPNVIQAVVRDPVTGNNPGNGNIGTDPQPKTGADSLLKQQEALSEIQFQKLRSEGLKVQSEAQARFGKGETEGAISQLQTYLGKVKDAQFEPAKVAMLSRPVESRLDQFRVMKKQQDFLSTEKKERDGFRKEMSQEVLSRQAKDKQLKELMHQFSSLMEAKKYNEAYLVMARAKEVDPDDTAVIAAFQVARTAKRSGEFKKEQEQNEEARYDAGRIDFGTQTNMKNPLSLDPDSMKRGQMRTDLSSGLGSLRARSQKEKEIERKLRGTISINFKSTPLPEVIDYFRTVTGINISLDRNAIEADGQDAGRMLVSETLSELSINSALNVVLKKMRLVHIPEDDVLKITTEKGVRGKLTQKIFPVADLVIPIQDFNPSPINSMNDVLTNVVNSNRPILSGITPTPFSPPQGLNGSTGTQVGTSSGNRGRLENTTSQPTVSVSNPKGTMEQSLIKLITSTVRPETWSDVGGPGTIDYYPIGSALVINQTGDVIEQIKELLDSLRQLQDLEVAIEIRLISLSEAFFERIGVDFDLNIKTSTKNIEPNITSNSFAPAPFINRNLGVNGATVGLTPAGSLTPDLNIPIRASSLPLAIPPFGGFQNSPGMDGGISFGLAFLNDIQVFMLLEAAQGDRRFNVMQAPKLTMFNGQTGTLNVNDQVFYMTGVQVISVGGQIVFSPQNTPFPFGVQMTLQPVISADRRFVRVTVNQQMTNLQSTNVPLFPITTFVTPVFDGGFTGQPIPFTQFIQQPTISNLSVQTTVAVPDGGTVLLGGLKTLSEGRNESGPPVLSKIPYLNRLFKNVGYGREAQSLMMMVTPRIIINREEQERATGVTDLPPGEKP